MSYANKTRDVPLKSPDNITKAKSESWFRWWGINKREEEREREEKYKNSIVKMKYIYDRYRWQVYNFNMNIVYRLWYRIK